LLFFESLVHEGRAKGFWKFLGVGLVERAELVTQIDRRNRPFVNYVFDCVLVDLGAEGLELSWNWIAARRDPTKTLEECLNLAPEAWQRWVEQGPIVKEKIRQQFKRGTTLAVADQRPDPGTPAEDALRLVVNHYKRIGQFQGGGRASL
jgi:hypothetical protein